MIYFIILVVCISLDAFILMMEKGAVMPTFDYKKALGHSLIFGAIASLMFISGGLIAGLFFNEKLLKLNRLVACIVLVFIGIKIIHQTSKIEPFVEKLDLTYSYRDSVHLAFVTGIDCFLIGLGLHYLHIPYLEQGFVVFVITLAIVFLALRTGYYEGLIMRKKAYYFSAVVYLVVAFLQLGMAF